MPDSKIFIVLISVIVIAGIFLLMAKGFRKKRAASTVNFAKVPENLDEEFISVEGVYLSSSLTENKLVRVSAGPLGFRGRVVVDIYADGLLIGIDGEKDFWIPKTDISEIAHESYTIDRAVEKDGMTVIRWQGGTVSSHFRIPVSGDKAINNWYYGAESVRAK